MWDFIKSLDIPNWFWMLLIVLAVYSFLTGKVKVFRDKTGKLMIKSLQQRSEYDIKKGVNLMKETVKKLEDHEAKDEAWRRTEFRDVSLEILKQAAFNEGLPMKERMHAGLKYIRSGGNSDTKTMVMKLIEEHPELYEGITVSHPEWKVLQ